MHVNTYWLSSSPLICLAVQNKWSNNLRWGRAITWEQNETLSHGEWGFNWHTMLQLATQFARKKFIILNILLLHKIKSDLRLNHDVHDSAILAMDHGAQQCHSAKRKNRQHTRLKKSNIILRNLINWSEVINIVYLICSLEYRGKF